MPDVSKWNTKIHCNILSINVGGLPESKNIFTPNLHYYSIAEYIFTQLVICFVCRLLFIIRIWQELYNNNIHRSDPLEFYPFSFLNLVHFYANNI